MHVQQPFNVHVAFVSTGEASAGKTQACLQLLVTCQWPLDHGGLHGKAM